ncbi:MAG: phosphate signaling complex protein PhoU [Candidatus Margulisbacteria bacterium]|nr:phosphate signaling complex protein PhoU [Candidatus Margulisiibacteriota bacterium]MBU1617038.1 phosphate signaling complex protein PhoU [Candidatus Margulisiibacteriota bacterium]
MDHKRVFDQELIDFKTIIMKMGGLVQSLIHRAIEALECQNVALAEEVISADEEIDRLELEIDEQSIQLIALRQPEASDLRLIMTGMKIANDLERIGDLAEDIARRAKELAAPPKLKTPPDIAEMARQAKNAVAKILDAFINLDPVKAKEVWENETIVDKLRDNVHNVLVRAMSQDGQDIRRTIQLLLISRHLERIVDHVTNLAEEIIYLVEAKVVKHRRPLN